MSPAPLLPLALAAVLLGTTAFVAFASNQASSNHAEASALIVQGTDDHTFPDEGALPCPCDLESPDFLLLDADRFAREEDGAFIARLMLEFRNRHAALIRKSTEFPVSQGGRCGPPHACFHRNPTPEV
jgi:hypothetical protein